MKRHEIEIPEDELNAFCKRNHIRKLSFFGSYLREDFKQSSDIDILVEFEAGHVPGLAFFSMEEELSEIIGHKVDLNTPQFLSRYFRDKVTAEARVLYDAA
ncbi:MAG: nucleotidyltransferase family protein [Thermoleophilia bacterium]